MLRQIDVLLVEDDPADAELTLRALAHTGTAAAVEHARDGEEALDALGARGLRPRVILLDLKLPGMTGLELLRRIRSDPETCTLPVVVFTSSAETRDLAGSYSFGANGYAQKPVEFGEFGEAVGRLCDFWLRVNRVPPASSGG
ncbi:MAG: response regulator [Gemmatimonadales bacterium]|nr:response regulator [Gemmatimonadales bacterium]